MNTRFSLLRLCLNAKVTGAVLLLFTLVVPMQAAQAATLSGNAYFDHVLYSISGDWVDETAAASNITTNDVHMSAGIGSTLYIGSQSPFDAVMFELGTWGVGENVQLAYWYSSPSGFTSFVPSGNPSNNFTISNPDNVTDIRFSASDMAKQTVNGVSAYWVRIRTDSVYTVPPKFTRIRGRIYNVKLQLNTSWGSAYSTDIIPTLSSCASDGFPSGEMAGYRNAGGGVHYYALRTDGGNCALNFTPSGYVTSLLSIINNTTSLRDFTNSPLILMPRSKVVVNDEAGNNITDATVVSDYSVPPTAVSGNTYYFASSGEGTGKPIHISRLGYVSEVGSGVSGNTALLNVQNGTTASQTFVNLSGNTPCVGSVAAGAMATCRALMRDMRFQVTNSGGTPLSNVTVTFYTNPGMTQMGDDVSKTGGSADSQGTTDTYGEVKMALASGTYYYRVTAAGYNEATGSMNVTSGNLNTGSAALTALQSPPPQDTTPSASASYVGVSPTSVLANGVNTATITVIARNAANVALSGKIVTLATSLPAAIVSPSQATTDVSGVATFSLRSSTAGTAQMTVTINGVVLSTKPSVQFTTASSPSSCTPVVPFGSLIKLPDDSNPITQEDTAVYYYGKDCKRHAFPNSRVYFTWYQDFSSVMTVPLSALSSMSLGKNVTYRPGVKMVKFTTLNNVYAVSRYGTLRWVKSESIASSMYGSSWNVRIDDIADTFFNNYVFGNDINYASEYSPSTEMANAPTIDDNL